MNLLRSDFFFGRFIVTIVFTRQRYVMKGLIDVAACRFGFNLIRSFRLTNFPMEAHLI